ncbi:hypothetical protein [Prolixibacter sp. SD074]|jgi:hypothetical protein|uniref:hypothetical protein n=1 Tax=Prolixibacter sp. SD074 TaxID=2652391 RepID=UPI0012992A38|nr:hypothetical protein [Prolixibacter sp. SD074]
MDRLSPEAGFAHGEFTEYDFKGYKNRKNVACFRWIGGEIHWTIRTVGVILPILAAVFVPTSLVSVSPLYSPFLERNGEE